MRLKSGSHFSLVSQTLNCTSLSDTLIMMSPGKRLLKPGKPSVSSNNLFVLILDACTVGSTFCFLRDFIVLQNSCFHACCRRHYCSFYS